MILTYFITWMEYEACFWTLSLFQVNYNCHFYKFLGEHHSFKYKASKSRYLHQGIRNPLKCNNTA